MKQILVASLVALMSSQVFAMDSLSDLRWRNRVVLVFGALDDHKLAQQVKILTSQPAELEERDMVVITISENHARAVHGKSPVPTPSDLRREADIMDETFHVVLVGKDGEIKLRSEKIVGGVEMFDLIDRMPMRRAGRS